MFLPDRYVKGTCPRCGTPDQYGDSCENCGATYTPADLIDPLSVDLAARRRCGASPSTLLQARRLRGDPARVDARGGALQAAVREQARRVVRGGPAATGTSRATRPTSASRSPTRRASTSTSGSTRRSATWPACQRLCAEHGLDFDAYWTPDSDAELHHFIGKDIVYFHTLFWPAMLHGAGFASRPRVHVHGFLTVNGEKMSKSRGTFITARALPRAPAARAICATTSRPSSGPASRTST